MPCGQFSYLHFGSLSRSYQRYARQREVPIERREEGRRILILDG